MTGMTGMTGMTDASSSSRAEVSVGIKRPPARG
jgi:hypothetical protein